MKAALLRSVSVNLAELRRVLMCESRGCGTRPDAGCEGCFEEKVANLAGKVVKNVTIKVYIPLIYIVNSSLQSKYWKI